MSKKLILFLSAFIFLSGFNFALADVVIDEIMYDPLGTDTNVEWIEVQNVGTEQVDLSTWSVADYDTAWHFHAITPENQSILNAGAYALIVHTSQANFADFKSKMPSYNGLLFRSSFTLGNDTGRLALSPDKINISNDTTYTATSDTSNTGNSLQLINGAWVSATPTPGTVNQISSSTTSTTSGGTGGLSSVSVDLNNSSAVAVATVVPTKSKIVEEPKIKTQIITKTLGFVNIPFSLQATALGYSGEPLHFGKYFWNFGDGDSKEVDLIDSQSFTHTYFYPGEYNVNLDYYSSHYSELPDASNQVTIKIVPLNISISKVGDESDFFVELTNNSDYNTDISNWILTSGQKSFTIPRDTTLVPQGKIMISPKITNFSIADRDTLKLMTAGGQIVFDYASSIAPNVTVQSPDLVANIPVAKLPEKKISKIEVKNEADKNGDNQNKKVVQAESSLYAEPEIPVENLVATATSGIANNTAENNMREAILSVISIIFVGASASAVYIIRRRGITPEVANVEPDENIGNDFEILDE